MKNDGEVATEIERSRWGGGGRGVIERQKGPDTQTEREKERKKYLCALTGVEPERNKKEKYLTQ